MKVSIIVPIYNMEKTLSKCIDSLVHQTMKDIEIILINDGSSDNSLNIINSYTKDKRIKVINQENKGISVARNNGIKIASSKYLCFVDSDDYISLDMVEKLYNAVTSKNASICVCDYYTFDESNIKEIKVGSDNLFGGTLLEHPNLIKDIDFAPWNKIYKKELFDNIEFPVQTKYEDLETILKVFSKADKIVKLNEPLYYYYVNISGETKTNSPKDMDMLKIAINLNNYFDFKGKDKVLNDYFFEVISQKMLYIAPMLFKIVDRETVMKYLHNVYSFLDTNEPKWKILYKRNKIDSKYIKFIRGNKLLFKTYAFLRITLYKIIRR